MPFFGQIWLFITPVIYPASKVATKLASLGLPTWLYGLNPMAGVVEGFRWALLRTGRPPGMVICQRARDPLVIGIGGLLLPPAGEDVCR